jgi:hypothetical protein
MTESESNVPIAITDDILIKYITKRIKEKNKDNKLISSKKYEKNKTDTNDTNDTNDTINNIYNEDSYIKPLEYKKIDKLPGNYIYGTNIGNLWKYFDDNMYRHGVIHQIQSFGEKNVTFYYSVLYLIKDNFETLSSDEKSKCVERFIKKVSNLSTTSLFTKFEYKNIGWTKKMLVNDIQSNDITSIVMRYIADLCHINIFIIDIEKDILYYSGFNPCIIYKKNILLLKHNESIFEPITILKKKYCNDKSKFINFISQKQHIVQLLSWNLNILDKKKNNIDNTFFKIGKGTEDFNIFKKIEIIENDDINLDNIMTVSYNKLLEFANKCNICTTYIRDGEKRNIIKDKLLILVKKYLNNLGNKIDNSNGDCNKDNVNVNEDDVDVDVDVDNVNFEEIYNKAKSLNIKTSYIDKKTGKKQKKSLKHLIKNIKNIKSQ